MRVRLRNWRARRTETGGYEAAVRLDDRDGSLRVIYPDGSEQTIAWDALERIEVHTNDSGPWGADVWWVLIAGGGRCAYPQGATGEEDLLPKLQGLPDFDNEALIDAMRCTSNRVFVCWTRPVQQRDRH